MTPSRAQSGFSLIELLVAATIFTFVVSGVTGLFLQALDLQRRATGIQKIQENALYILESIAREVRVSVITSGDTNCTPPDPVTTRNLTLQHPINGAVTYAYDRTSGVGIISRNGQPITSSDVDVELFAFCVRGSGVDGQQSQVTIPMSLRSVAGRASSRVSLSLQTSVVSRDLSIEMSQ